MGLPVGGGYLLDFTIYVENRNSEFPVLGGLFAFKLSVFSISLFLCLKDF